MSKSITSIFLEEMNEAIKLCQILGISEPVEGDSIHDFLATLLKVARVRIVRLTEENNRLGQIIFLEHGTVFPEPTPAPAEEA